MRKRWELFCRKSVADKHGRYLSYLSGVARSILLSNCSEKAEDGMLILHLSWKKMMLKVVVSQVFPRYPKKFFSSIS